MTDEQAKKWELVRARGLLWFIQIGRFVISITIVFALTELSRNGLITSFNSNHGQNGIYMPNLVDWIVFKITVLFCALGLLLRYVEWSYREKKYQNYLRQKNDIS